MKKIILIKLALFFVSTNLHAAVITGPVSGQSFDLINQTFFVDAGERLTITHDADINFINTSILGGIGSSIFIETVGNILMDNGSKFLAPGGVVNLSGGSINLLGQIDLQNGLMELNSIEIMPIESDVTLSPATLIHSSRVLTLGGDINIFQSYGNVGVTTLITRGIISGKSLDISTLGNISSGGTLNVSAVPVPTALLLFISAIGYLFAWTRKNRSSQTIELVA
tara:strand:- start:19190 stop:19864 length:675 start_codon:yes stop_codon:yes gene_type:complete